MTIKQKIKHTKTKNMTFLGLIVKNKINIWFLFYFYFIFYSNNILKA